MNEKSYWVAVVRNLLFRGLVSCYIDERDSVTLKYGRYSDVTVVGGFTVSSQIVFVSPVSMRKFTDLCFRVQV